MRLRVQLDIEVEIDAKDRDEALKKFHAGLDVYTNPGEIRVEKTTLRAFTVVDSSATEGTFLRPAPGYNERLRVDVLTCGSCGRGDGCICAGSI